MGGLVGALARGLAFGLGMVLVSLGASYVWTIYWAGDVRNMAREASGDAEATETRLRREIAAYNANLRELSTPQIEATGASLSGRTVLTRFMMNRFVAPGERADLALQLRRRHFAEVCRRQGLALRAGYRFVFSYADVVGGEIRFEFAAADC